MKASPTIAELSKALTKFQKAMPPIPQNSEAKIGSYSYKYADLASIWSAVRGILADNGLSVVQGPSSFSGEQSLMTMVMHESGEWLESAMTLKIMQDTPQGQGSAITYARRYALCAMLGIVADSDNDAQDHKAMTTIQKKQLADTVRKVLPEIGDDPFSMVRAITEIVGKHPSRLTAEEYDDAIQAVEGYTAKVVKEPNDD